MKISVILAIRNGEKYIKFLDNIFDKIKESFKGQDLRDSECKFENNIDFEYFIYENNSTDNTKEEIKNFYNKNRMGKYLLEDIENNTLKTGINFERGVHMANIRNNLKDFHGQLDSDYVLLLDCDSVFTVNTIKQLINTLNDKIVMTSPFCISWKQFLYNNYIHYYDTFAIITKYGLSFKNNLNTCLFTCCKMCTNYRQEMIKKGLIQHIDEQNIFNTNESLNV